MWGTLSDERTGLSFIIAAGPRQRIHIYSGQNQHYILSIFTILHVGILQTVVKSPFPCGYLLFTVLHVTLVYMYVQYCDICAVSRKRLGKHVATEGLIPGNQLITKHCFRG
jgi:hypothetical protein